MSGTDTSIERREANKAGESEKTVKGLRSVKIRLLVVIGVAVVVMVLSLGGLYMWIVRDPYVDRVQWLRWRIDKLFGVRRTACRVACGTNVYGILRCLAVYANDCDGRYPPADKWCDLLIEYDYTTPKQFVCTDARRKGDKGRSHYAINPNAAPASDPNVVLVFETRRGWNQSGGPEILYTGNHDGRGCNVAFVGGRVRFVQTKDLDRLKWK